MNNKFTLLFIVYFCCQLSVSGFSPGAPKMGVIKSADTSASKHQQDSSKVTDVYKLTKSRPSVATNHSIKLANSLPTKNNAIFLTPAAGSYSLKLSLPVLYANNASVSMKGNTGREKSLAPLE